MMTSDYAKHKVIISNEMREPVFTFKLPWCLPPLRVLEKMDLHAPGISGNHLPCLIVLIQAGYSALGISESGEIKEHKVIQKYMVRKKQGKAQITYLNKKGKSRAGSRIRLAETVEFFEEINDRMASWMTEYDVRRILISCSEQMWGLLFQSKVRVPFEKKDARILKIPVHVHRPKFAELKHIHYLAQRGSVEISPEFDSEFLEVLTN